MDNSGNRVGAESPHLKIIEVFFSSLQIKNRKLQRDVFCYFPHQNLVRRRFRSFFLRDLRTSTFEKHQANDSEIHAMRTHHWYGGQARN